MTAVERPGAFALRSVERDDGHDQALLGLPPRSIVEPDTEVGISLEQAGDPVPIWHGLAR